MKTSEDRRRKEATPMFASYQPLYLIEAIAYYKQGNYSLRRPPKLVIPQAVIGQRWATVYSNLYKQTVIHSKSTS